MLRSPRAMLAAALLATALTGPAAARTLNGFQLEPAAIPQDQILRGGPPRDGIPALTDPRVLRASFAPWPDDARVIGVALGHQARAYPIAILDWHELVNDELGGRAILVSYCPLCGSALVFDRELAGRVRTFGVSGLLYQSDLLLYDRESESLWSQILASAVTGPALGTRLRVLRSSLTTWGEWRVRHPRATVLSPRTGHARDYRASPYGNYADSRELRFPVARRDRRYHPKMPTAGLRLPSGRARGYPAQEVMHAGGELRDTFAGHAVWLRYRPETRTFEIAAPDAVEVVEAYWFAWTAFHPEAEVFTHPAPERDGATGLLGWLRGEPDNWR